MKQLVFLLLFLGTAVAEDHTIATAHNMYSKCKIAIRVSDGQSNGTGGDDIWYGFCMGYLRGFADALNDFSPPLKVNLKDVSSEALMRSFVNYVDAHPGEMDDPQLAIVLLEAWKADKIIITAEPVKQ